MIKNFEMDARTLLVLVGKYYAEAIDELPGDKVTCSFEIIKPWFGKPTGIRFIYESQPDVTKGSGE